MQAVDQRVGSALVFLVHMQTVLRLGAQLHAAHFAAILTAQAQTDFSVAQTVCGIVVVDRVHVQDGLRMGMQSKRLTQRVKLLGGCLPFEFTFHVSAPVRCRR